MVNRCGLFMYSLYIWWLSTFAPAFYLSFVITPFCSNASELVSSLMFAAKKKKVNTSLTYSQVSGRAGVCFLWLISLKFLQFGESNYGGRQDGTVWMNVSNCACLR